MGVWAGTIRPPGISQPHVEELIGSPEYFADGMTFLDRGPIMTALLYVERLSGDRLINYEVCRVHFARARWIAGTQLALQVLRKTIGGGVVH